MSNCGLCEQHCCWFKGEQCKYLIENYNGRRWSCGLLIESGSWENVHKDFRYIEDVKPKLDEVDGIENCDDWPLKGVKCNACGDIGG